MKKDRLWQMCVRQHYAEINEAARNRMELIVRSLADEIVKAELIYN